MFPREGADPRQALEVKALLSSVPLKPLLLSHCCFFLIIMMALCCIITSLAPRRHERINTRKTLIIESCPDDDLVNLEFLDEVKFKAFISLCIDLVEAQSV